VAGLVPAIHAAWAGKPPGRGSGTALLGGVLGAQKRWGRRFTKNGICAIPFPLEEFVSTSPLAVRERQGKSNFSRLAYNLRREFGSRAIFLFFLP
jgi:hypothetical protein